MKGELIMPEPLVELVQQDVQVYSAPDDFFASFDDDSRALVEQWRAECKDVDDWLSTVDPKLEQEADGTDLPRVKDELCKTRVSTGHSHSPYADAARYGGSPNLRLTFVVRVHRLWRRTCPFGSPGTSTWRRNTAMLLRSRVSTKTRRKPFRTRWTIYTVTGPTSTTVLRPRKRGKSRDPQSSDTKFLSSTSSLLLFTDWRTGIRAEEKRRRNSGRFLEQLERREWLDRTEEPGAGRGWPDIRRSEDSSGAEGEDQGGLCSCRGLRTDV